MSCVHLKCSQNVARKIWYAVIGLFCAVFPCDKLRAQPAAGKLQVGLLNRISFHHLNLNSTFPGMFLNVNISRKVNFEVEYRNSTLVTGHDALTRTERSFFEKLQRRDWSASLAFNYHFKPSDGRIAPYVGVGAGQYYIHDSKARIKKGKADPQQGDIEFDMRRYFKRPGFFGTVGFKLKATARTTLYLHGKCNVVFDKHRGPALLPCNYSDLFNISTGIRFSLN